jgi:cytochrome c peroxidase
MDPALSGDGSRSCDTCHPGGGENGKVYANAEEVPPATPDAFNVPSLRGVWQTPPYLWDGSIRNIQEVLTRMLSIEMRDGQMAEIDFRALQNYVLSIPVFDRGRIQSDGTPVEPALLSTKRGFEVFKQQKCVRCHPPPVFSKSARVDMGTGKKIDVPTLRGVGSSPPFGHDGRWSTLGEAVEAVIAARREKISRRQLAELLAYLQLL